MSIRAIFSVPIAAAVLAASTPAAAQSDAPRENVTAVTAEVIAENDGTRTLVHQAVIDAPVAEVWKTLSTAEGWMMWGPAFAKFDLRNGGSIETAYHADATIGDDRNIRHRILAFVPERMLVIRVAYAPPGPIDPTLLSQMWAVYELAPIGDSQTKLRISGYGYGMDEASTKLLDFFKQGNVWSIETMRKNLAVQPGTQGETSHQRGE